jgi:hypothetical protein
MTTSSLEIDTQKMFEPDNVEQLLRGWLLHAHKGRHRHDRAARRCDRERLWVGGIAAALSGVVGTSVFAALGTDTSVNAKLAVAMISIVSAILTGLNGFLNLSERTERHRAAGVRYKTVIRELERLLSATDDLVSKTDPPILDVQKRLDDLEETAPVVPERIFDQVEDEWKRRGAEFVGKAADLYHSKAEASDR